MVIADFMQQAIPAYVFMVISLNAVFNPHQRSLSGMIRHPENMHRAALDAYQHGNAASQHNSEVRDMAPGAT
jgi:hypothetical protein